MEEGESMRRLAAVLVLLTACAARADDWSTADTVMQGAVIALQVADWGQTAWGLQRGYSETNPVLGSHPTRARLNVTAAGAIIGHAVIARLLPHPYRSAWQATVIVVEIGYVARNASLIGLQWSLP